MVNIVSGSFNRTIHQSRAFYSIIYISYIFYVEPLLSAIIYLMENWKIIYIFFPLRTFVLHWCILQGGRKVCSVVGRNFNTINDNVKCFLINEQHYKLCIHLPCRIRDFCPVFLFLILCNFESSTPDVLRRISAWYVKRYEKKNTSRDTKILEIHKDKDFSSIQAAASDSKFLSLSVCVFVKGQRRRTEKKNITTRFTFAALRFTAQSTFLV